MKKFLLVATFVMLALGVTTAAEAQNKPKAEKDKTDNNKFKTENDKDKLSDYDEIIIKRKGDKGGKVTVQTRTLAWTT